MSSINQLVSEIATSINQTNNIVIRRSIKMAIIHSRNDIIRKTYNNHKVLDRSLFQKFIIELVDVNDDNIPFDGDFKLIKRSNVVLPKSVRIDNGCPFHTVRTIGSNNNIVIPYTNPAVSNYYKELPGMQNVISYDYINGYLYINYHKYSEMTAVNNIIVESIFELPQNITDIVYNQTMNLNGLETPLDDNEFLLPEDMIPTIKIEVMKQLYPELNKLSNEVPVVNKLG